MDAEPGVLWFDDDYLNRPISLDYGVRNALAIKAEINTETAAWRLAGHPDVSLKGLAKALDALSPQYGSVSRLQGADSSIGLGFAFELFVEDCWKQCRTRRFRHVAPPAGVARARATELLGRAIERATAGARRDARQVRALTAAAEKYGDSVWSLYLVAREAAVDLYRQKARAFIPQVGVHDAELRRREHPAGRLPKSCRATACDAVCVCENGDYICAEFKVRGYDTDSYTRADAAAFWADGREHNIDASVRTRDALQAIGAAQLFDDRRAERDVVAYRGAVPRVAPMLYTALMQITHDEHGRVQDTTFLLRRDDLHDLYDPDNPGVFPYTVSLRCTNALRPPAEAARQ